MQTGLPIGSRRGGHRAGDLRVLLPRRKLPARAPTTRWPSGRSRGTSRRGAWRRPSPAWRCCVAASFLARPGVLHHADTFGLFFFYKTRIVPEHFWASRRFLAVILPGALIVIAGPRACLADRRSRGTATAHGLRCRGASRRPCSSPLSGWRSGWRRTPVRAHVEYGGLIPQLENLAGHASVRAISCSSNRVTQDPICTCWRCRWPTSTRSTCSSSTRRSPPKRALENFVTWASTTYDRVLFLGGGGTDLLSRYLAAEPLASDRFHVPEYETRVNDYPSGVRRKDFEFGLYRLTRTRPVAARPDRDSISGRMTTSAWCDFMRANDRTARHAVSLEWTAVVHPSSRHSSGCAAASRSG